MNIKTYSPRPKDITRKWFAIDASQAPLGRVAAKCAHILQGKHKPHFAKHADVGDYIVIINGVNVQVTGAKEKKKIYYKHTGYPGGLKQRNVAQMREKNPAELLLKSVKGMLPQGPLGRKMLTRLKINLGNEYRQQAQQPEFINVER